MIWSSLGSVHDIIQNTNLILFTETHEKVVKGLSPFTGYSWISTFRTSTHQGSYKRGLGGVAFLINDRLHRRMWVEGIDTHARYIWLSIARSPPLRRLYIACCYFPTMTSCYAIHGEGESPFLDLFPDISRYAVHEDIILVGDFNGRTRSLQT